MKRTIIRKLVFSLFVISGLAVSSAVASVASNTTIERFTLPIAIPYSEIQCQDLPPGVTSVTGVANVRVVTTVSVNGGTTRINSNSFADGTATDNLGTDYRFNYASHQNFVIPPGGYPQQVRMTDHFNLVGRGRDQIHVGFVIVGTIESPSDVFPWHTTFISLRGDPLFACDPI